VRQLAPQLCRIICYPLVSCFLNLYPLVLLSTAAICSSIWSLNLSHYPQRPTVVLKLFGFQMSNCLYPVPERERTCQETDWVSMGRGVIVPGAWRWSSARQVMTITREMRAAGNPFRWLYNRTREIHVVGKCSIWVYICSWFLIIFHRTWSVLEESHCTKWA